jgi:hypothetical protein
MKRYFISQLMIDLAGDIGGLLMIKCSANRIHMSSVFIHKYAGVSVTRLDFVGW